MNIFISYSHEDQAKVRTRVKELKKDSTLDVFWDQEMPGGPIWREFLAKELTVASAMVVFVSKAAADSRNVLDEVALALRRKTVWIIPVYLEELDEDEMFSNPLMLAIRNLNHIKAHKLNVGDCCAKIIEATRAQPPTAGIRCPVIAVMGVAGGVGKTTFVKATSELIASTGHNVLLIDIDCVADGLTSDSLPRAKGQRNVQSVFELLVSLKAGNPLPRNPQKDFWDVTPNYLR